MLLLDICNKTMTNVVKPTQGRYILYTKNHLIDSRLVDALQLTDIVAQIYDLMNMIETIQMDNNEFVALKVSTLLFTLSIIIFKFNSKLK